MKTVYLHIGTPKTGTKALQTFCRENEEWLNKQGYAYPQLPSSDPRLFKNRNARFLVNYMNSKKEEAGIEGFNQLESVLKEYDKIILSEEILWYYGKRCEDFWERILEKFNTLGCEVKIIVYLRRQDLLVQSLWNQSIKLRRKSTKTFYEYVENKEYEHFPLDYYEQLKWIEKQVSKENIIVRVYEDSQYEGNEKSIFSDFLKVVGLELDNRCTMENVAKNSGLSSEFLEMKRIMNGVDQYVEMPDFLAKSMVLANMSENCERTQYKTSMFEYEDQLAFLKQFEESNCKVAIEYLNREDGVLFRERVVELPMWEVDWRVMHNNIIVFMTEVFCEQRKMMLKQQERIHELEKTQKQMYESAIFRGYRRVRNIAKKRDEATE